MIQPEETILQYSDLNGNINHQGILSSNINNTTIQTSFPTTNTGDSIGTYHHLGIDGQNNNKTDVLNCSGTLSGGFNFWSSSSSTSPRNLMSLTTQGITIDNSISSGGGGLALPTVILCGPTYAIFQAPVNNAPYNIVGYGNPIQVYQNTATLSVGVTYYATGLTPQEIQVCTDPQGQNILDTSDLAFVPQPILFIPNGGPPVITTITTNLSGQTLTFVNDTNTSQLSSTDLTFNSVSIRSQINSNSSDIADQQNQIDIMKIKAITPFTQFQSAAITADGHAPSGPTSTISQTYGFTPCWYYKNTNSGAPKINWYIAPNIGMTVGDVIGFYLYLFNGVTTSNDNTPFLTIYTKPTGSNDYASWYHSSCTYVLNQTVTPVANTRYTFFMNVSSTCPNPNHYGSTLVAMQISTVNNPKGDYQPDQEILAFSIGTNSASPYNSVEFGLSKFGIMTYDGTTEIQFIFS